MTVKDVQEEVCSVFSKPMGQKKDFPFIFLQPTGAGSRTLTIPAVSSSLVGLPQQVDKLGSGNKQLIYIFGTGRSPN